MTYTLLIIFSYLFCVFSIASFFVKKQSLDSYFINQRHTNVWVMTLSLVTSVLNFGSIFVIFTEVTRTGISYGVGFLFGAISGMIFLRIFSQQIKTFGDLYGAYNIVDYLGKKFDRNVRLLVGFIQLLLIFLVLSIQIAAVSVFAAAVLNISYSVAVMCITIIALTYTVIGGFRIDLFTDFIQFWILIVTFGLLLFFVGANAGSLSETFSQIPIQFYNPASYGGIFWLIGTFLLGGLSYVANASQWQRILSAKDINTVQRAYKRAIIVVVCLAVIIVLLGLFSVVTAKSTGDLPFISMLEEILPTNMFTIMLAVILAVSMSSIDTSITTGSTIAFSLLFKKYEYTQKQELLNARIVTAIIGFLGCSIALLHPNVVTVASIVTHLTLTLVPAVLVVMYMPWTSARAVIRSVIIPGILFILLYPFLHMKTFLITTPLAFLIVLFYDKLYPRSVVIYSQEDLDKVKQKPANKKRKIRLQ